ncbi:hypothetical protein JJB97_14455 [Enterobacterales bacterium BIT-L3]|uniref:Uncharacterized protein n=2 Tax=Tenebrionibacter/Tenebrionicola group TaxID=2969848 RepID=A0A8K0XYB2_9ENTR|nr:MULTISPECIES: hypothetical protein [Tenebrionibacter/Tenebrionicola group]MBK4716508.1 hypothetical protein [Tenebrionibacter intestinalis]MBV5097212.1 hypothetical protein [Tenebrionicola larvae]
MRKTTTSRAQAANDIATQNKPSLKGYYGWDVLNDTRLLTPRLKQPVIRYRKNGPLAPATRDNESAAARSGGAIANTRL